MNHSVQPISVVERGDAEGVELVRGPEMCGKVLDEDCRRVDPIGFLERGRKLNMLEALEPDLRLFRRKRAEICKYGAKCCIG